jgi:hypothetical protein
MGHLDMARQCQLHEAYNLMYAGFFQKAQHVLTILENDIVASNGEKTAQRKETWPTKGYHDDYDDQSHSHHRMIRQCHAARLFLRRLRKLYAGGGLRLYHPTTKDHHPMHKVVDDFQRIRIVVDSEP